MQPVIRYILCKAEKKYVLFYEMKEDKCMQEWEKMTIGKIYDTSDDLLKTQRNKAHKLCLDYNQLYEDKEDERNAILEQLIEDKGKGLYLQGPIQFDYGVYTSFGENCYANFNLTILDCAKVTIGDNVFFGPNCSLMTPMHPYLPEERNLKTKEDGTAYTIEYARPIQIGNDCWIASNVTVCGGVRIGDGCVIGAGSVVTRDIPAGSLAAGNPCRVIRKITEKDSIEFKKNLY